MKAWHTDARRLRASGRSPKEISVILGYRPSTVSWVLDENGEREASRERTRQQRGTLRRARYSRKPAKTPVDTITAATKAFAAGDIDRAELMRRIGGGRSHGV